MGKQYCGLGGFASSEEERLGQKGSGPVRTIESWNGWVERDIKAPQPQPLPWAGCPPPDQAAQGPIQPILGHLQGEKEPSKGSPKGGEGENITEEKKAADWHRCALWRKAHL